MSNTLSINKIFHFEAAHALHNYSGSCQFIHGHSYKLQVSIGKAISDEEFIEGIGILYDFKDLKRIVSLLIEKYFDHKLIVSQKLLDANPGIQTQSNLVVLPYEPSAENMVIFLKKEITKSLPTTMEVKKLRLYETNSSFVEWTLEGI